LRSRYRRSIVGWGEDIEVGTSTRGMREGGAPPP